MADVDIKVKISKDSADFDSGIKNSTSAAEKLADTVTDRLGGDGRKVFGDLAGIINGRLAVALGAAGVAGLALKKTFDFTLEAEKIQQIQNSFNALASSAGLSGQSLQEGLSSATRGLADGDDVLQAANRAIVQLGENASILPQTMELARKATSLFGGDLVTNFQAFNDALASGNVRALRQFGIIVDSDKALKDFARTQGVSVSALNDQGKKQAIMNAALEVAKSKLSSVDETTNQATQAYQKFQVSFKELGDAIAETAQQSGFFKTLLTSLGDAADYAGRILKERFGNGLDNQNLKTELASSRVAQLETSLKSLQATQASAPSFAKDQFNEQIVKTKQDLDLARIAMDDYRKSQVLLSQAKPEEKSAAPKSFIDPAVVQQQQAQALGQIQGFRGQLLAAQEAYYSQNNDLAQRTIDLDAISEQKKVLIMQEFEAKRIALIAQQAQTRTLTKQQMDEAEVTLEAEKQYKLLSIVSESQAQIQARTKQLNESLKSSLVTGMTNSIAGFGKAIATGENAFSAFGKSMLEMLGDMAIQIGQFMLIGGLGLQSLYSGNPAGSIVYGVALIALGGLLKGFASKGSAGGGGVASQPANAGGEITSNPELESRGPQSTISVVVQGSVFDSDESGMRIAEMLKEQFNMRDVKVA